MNQFLEKSLSRFMPSNIVEAFLTEDNMKLWETAFTHISVSTKNYEVYEKTGDKKADSILVDIFRLKFKGELNEEQYSGLISYYHSEEFFSKLGQNEGFDKILRASPRIKEDPEALKKISEDLFEAFVGVLSVIGDEVAKKFYGVHGGYLFSQQYMFYIFNDIEIDLIHASGSFQNQLQEIMKNFGIPLNRMVQPAGYNNVISYFFVPKNLFLQIIEQLGKEPSNEQDPNITRFLTDLGKQEKYKGNFILLGSGIASKAEEADRVASKIALDYLWANYDLDRETAKKFKDKIISNKTPDQEQVERYFKDVEVVSHSYGPFRYYYLVGTSKGKRQVITEYKTASSTNFATGLNHLYAQASERLKKQESRSEGNAERRSEGNAERRSVKT